MRPGGGGGFSLVLAPEGTPGLVAQFQGNLEPPGAKGRILALPGPKNSLLSLRKS
jgi:hypothetical protein